jgi:hypothetical protein
MRQIEIFSIIGTTVLNILIFLVLIQSVISSTDPGSQVHKSTTTTTNNNNITPSTTSSSDNRAPLDVSKLSKKIFPPYPNIWDWHEKSTKGHPFSMHILYDGDVIVSYYKEKITNITQNYAITFFKRRKYIGNAAINVISKASNIASSNLNIHNNVFDYMEYEAISHNGEWHIKSVYVYDLDCYVGPNRNPYKLTNTKTGKERIFTIFKLLDKPEYFFVNGRYGHPGTSNEGKEYPNASCVYQTRRNVKVNVKSVNGDFIFLADDTFLFHVEDSGEVLRFDTDLKSKSTLVGKKFFIIENTGTPFLVDELYPSKFPTDGDAQKITNILYQYLMERREK